MSITVDKIMRYDDEISGDILTSLLSLGSLPLQTFCFIVADVN